MGVGHNMGGGGGAFMRAARAVQGSWQLGARAASTVLTAIHARRRGRAERLNCAAGVCGNRMYISPPPKLRGVNGDGVGSH